MDLEQRIKEVIEMYTEAQIDHMTMESDLSKDLGLTSFDLMCLVSAIEEEYGITISNDMMGDLKKVGHVYEMLQAYNIEV